MLIVTVTIGAPQLAQLVRNDPVVGHLFSAGTFAVATLPVPSPPLKHLLELTQDSPGFGWVLEHQRDNAASECDFYEVRPTKLLQLSDTDSSLNQFFMNARPFAEPYPESPIFVARGALLSAQLPKPKEIRCFAYAPEYVAGLEIADVLHSYDRTLELLPTYSKKHGWARTPARHLFTANVAPRALQGPAVWREQSKEGVRWRRCGCLAYQDLSVLKAFNRTAEPWTSWEYPNWVVSARVRELSLSHGTGWSFVPVFGANSPAYRAHLDAVAWAKSALSSNSKNRMR